MVRITDLEFTNHRFPENKQAIVVFSNRYGASVLYGQYSYTDDTHPYEIAVLYNGRVVYNTPITNNVCGYLTEDEANVILAQIEALPSRNPSPTL